MRLAAHAPSRRVLLVEDAAGLEDERLHRVIGLDASLLSYALILLVVTACLAERLKLPASSAAIVLGAAFGLLFRAAGLTRESSHVSSSALITFDEELFLFVLLPPIIFEAGFSLSRRHFFGNLATILLFAVVGTLITTCVIGQTIYAVGSARAFASPSGAADALDFSTPLDSYLFGALISATDPVATLSIMGAVNADPLVYNLIFGESVLNDAVAIVLVRILEDMGTLGFSDPLAYANGVVSFFTVSLGSLAVGVAVSAASALVLNRIDFSHRARSASAPRRLRTRRTATRGVLRAARPSPRGDHTAPGPHLRAARGVPDPSFELSLILLFGYASYATAEACDGSGILALFTTGVLCGHYHVNALSPAAREASGVTLKALAHLAETAVFAYMGVDLFAIAGAGVDAFVSAHAQLNASAAQPTPLPHPAHVLQQRRQMAELLEADGVGSGPADAAAAVAAAADDTSVERANILGFVFFALVVVILARILVMLPLCLLANCFRGARRQLSRRAMAMLVFAGLRGAIAFALAHNVHSAHRHAIAAATTTVVLATVFVLGGATRTVIKVLRMEAPPAKTTPALSRTVDAAEPAGPAGPAEPCASSMADGSGSGGGDGGAAPPSVPPATARAQRRAMNREQREPLSDGRCGNSSDSSAEAGGEAGGEAAQEPLSPTSLPMPQWELFDERYLQPIFGNRRRHGVVSNGHASGGAGGAVELREVRVAKRKVLYTSPPSAARASGASADLMVS
jgi:NhaP-type Na+/H+ or K+/H+ antiporter